VPDNMDRVGIIAEVATAVAAVTYPIVRMVTARLDRRRIRIARRYAAPAAAVEVRLIERCAVLEARLVSIESRLHEVV
jgi:hypothetical protein